MRLALTAATALKPEVFVTYGVGAFVPMFLARMLAGRSLRADWERRAALLAG